MIRNAVVAESGSSESVLLFGLVFRIELDWPLLTASVSATPIMTPRRKCAITCGTAGYRAHVVCCKLLSAHGSLCVKLACTRLAADSSAITTSLHLGHCREF